ADQRDDGHGPETGVVKMMDEGGAAEAPGLADHAAESRRDLAEKGGELDGVAPDAGHRLGHVVAELGKRIGLFELGPLDIAAPLHLLDQDAEGFGRSSVM